MHRKPVTTLWKRVLGPTSQTKDIYQDLETIDHITDVQSTRREGLRAALPDSERNGTIKAKNTSTSCPLHLL